MSSEDISIGEFESEVQGKEVNLTLYTKNVNSILSPVRYSMKFAVERVSVYNPATVRLKNENGWVELCQVNRIYRGQDAKTKKYILNCGRIPQRDIEFVLTLL